MILCFCNICNAAGTEVAPNEEVRFINFEPHEPYLHGKEDPLIGWHKNVGYFCREHYPAAQKLSHLPYRDAMAQLQKQFDRLDAFRQPSLSALRSWFAKLIRD